MDNLDNKVAAVIYDIKGVLSYTQRKDNIGITPKIQITTTRSILIDFVVKFLESKEITFHRIKSYNKSKKSQSVRVTHKKNCFKLIGLLKETNYLRFSLEEYNKMEEFCKPINK